MMTCSYCDEVEALPGSPAGDDPVCGDCLVSSWEHGDGTEELLSNADGRALVLGLPLHAADTHLGSLQRRAVELADVEALIASGLAAPGARGMAIGDVRDQIIEANALEG